MSEYKILLGSASFKAHLEHQAANAQAVFYAQAMTFEGDAAGRWLIDLMKSSPAKDKRLLIDAYSKVVINDHFVYSAEYLRNSDFRKEILETKKLIAEARSAGIQVTFTNPTGFMLYKYPLRNHKKMVVVDDVCYLGGINFSEHNFEWHDMMIAVGNKKISQLLIEDFLLTESGVNQSKMIKSDAGELYFTSGIRSEKPFSILMRHITEAKKSIQVISPYVSEPLLSQLKTAAERGISVSVFSPDQNNKSIFKDLLMAEARKGYFKLYWQPGMSHMKAILVDDSQLIFGSSNYDLISYYFEQELIFVSKEPALISEFKTEVLLPMIETAKQEVVSSVKGKRAVIILNIGAVFCRLLSRSVLRPN